MKRLIVASMVAVLSAVCVATAKAGGAELRATVAMRDSPKT
jgi:hypothetical protein